MEQQDRFEPEVRIEVPARKKPQQRHQGRIDRIADGEHEQADIVPPQHPAHIINVDRNIR